MGGVTKGPWDACAGPEDSSKTCPLSLGHLQTAGREREEDLERVQNVPELAAFETQASFVITKVLYAQCTLLKSGRQLDLISMKSIFIYSTAFPSLCVCNLLNCQIQPEYFFAFMICSREGVIRWLMVSILAVDGQVMS